MTTISLPADIASIVRRALSEDIGSGDLTAELIPADSTGKAVVISREDAILCGCAWFNEVFWQIDASIQINWSFRDGDSIQPDVQICELTGNTRTLLTGERTALNFLQLLSGTATITNRYTVLIEGLKTRLLDTRKTIPGLRSAQKYAVACGGGKNHRMGLYDAVLIKENHIHAAGSIARAVEQAKTLHRFVEIEVEDLAELRQALDAGADTIMLDNFTTDLMRQAVEINNGRSALEASGNITRNTLREIAETGVDYISIGDLTKNVQAIDFSMRIM